MVLNSFYMGHTGFQRKTRAFKYSFIFKNVFHGLYLLPCQYTKIYGMPLSFTPFSIKIVQQSNWLPKAMTSATGKELEKLSFLGPFFSLSVFAEDNTRVVDKFFSENDLAPDTARVINQQLQRMLEFSRVRNQLT